MECRVSELRYKEIINVDLESGQVRALVVPGRLRLFGLLGREEDRVFPWEAVRRFGADTILVETPPLSRLGKGN